MSPRGPGAVVLVDARNVIRSRWPNIRPDRFLRLVSAWAEREGVEALVVFDGSAPCGPWLVTSDEAGAPDAIEFSLTLNGDTMQAASTDDLVFGMAELVSRLSALMTLEPGDIVATGTPAGVGSVRTPRVWLKPGDEISLDPRIAGARSSRSATRPTARTSSSRS